jgi:hypothetical protein
MRTLINIKPLYVFGDTHIGVLRGGTTPETKQQLKQDLLKSFQALLDNASGSLLLNGDVFDTDSIDLKDLFETYRMLSDWLTKNDRLWLVAGNHGAANNSQKTSSFDLLCRLLSEVHGDKAVQVKDSLALPEHDAYVIGYSRNQDLFEAELAKVPVCSTLYLHCNVDNPHTAGSQHSLNLTLERSKSLPVERIVVSHEHNSRKVLNGKVHLIGCPSPSSVSDCLNSPEKYMVKVSGSEVEYISTWQAAGDFEQQDWRNLKDTGARFIRVVGTATAEESSDAVAAISRFRSTSKALVITNAVAVGDALDASQLAINAETVTAFDVKSALFDILEPEEVSVIKSLLGE